ncbi:Hsp20/alpha crystallin family protein [Thalassoroseus pseudoceratinae]|uniref:Hsp20/alpha crystallin family protein n=1 Tax=Thalassoroseus pseudoceratinae TaxID=2713176 RepID=UPI001423762D|nr:Hsp20/alpha crystallin family protein [Thalassoroseus pseudoceratinae]
MVTEDPQADGPLGSSVEKLRSEMDKWIEVVRSSGSRAWETLKPRNVDHRFIASADLVETTEDVRVFLDIPGVDPRTLEVNLTGNMLSVKGIKSPSPSGEGQVTHLDERAVGSFSRALPLPAPVDPEQVSAEVNDGVLTIVLMKSERAKPHQIQVQVGNQGSSVSLGSGN